MKTAIILPVGFRFDLKRPNSIETVVRTLAPHSRDDITVFADTGASEHGDFDVVEVDPAGGRWKRTDKVIEAVRKAGAEFLELHQHGPTARVIARAFPGLPNAYYRHNFLKAPTGPLQRWRHTRRNRDFDAHVFVSEATRAAFARAFPVFADRSHAIPNGIDPDPWWAEPDAGGRIIAYAGRAAPEKGFAEMCAAIGSVLDLHPDWSVGMCASAWATHRDWAEAQVAPLGRFGDRFRLQKDQPVGAVQTLLKSASIALVPSQIFEAFGLAAIEAHVAGCALISSGTGGLREASGDHALYLPEVSAATISDAVGRLIDDPALRLDLATRGQAYCLSEHGAAHRAGQLDALRARIAARHR